MPTHHIQLRNATKRYRGSEDTFELYIPTMQLKRGGLYIVAGRSGCGKTTLLDAMGCMSSFDEVTEYSLHNLQGEHIALAKASNLTLAETRRRHIGYVLQQGGLLPFLTAKQNILLPIELSLRSKSRKEAALDMIAQLGLTPKHLNYYPHALSIGQRQRVCIARALAHRPEFLLADEPTGALDPANAGVVRDLLLKYARYYGVTTLIVTHDVELFAGDADGIFGFDIDQQASTTRSTLIAPSTPQ